MPSDPVRVALSHLRFSSNTPFAEHLEQAGGRVERQATGHLIAFRPDGRRFLAADPSGNPLHECEWGQDPQGRTRLLRARVRLDWGRWIGIKPAGLVNESTLNLASKPGWQRITPDELRQMAARAMRVSVEEVRFFYNDEDLVIDTDGRATIRHKKDALYVLEDGTFECARFMSCMGALHWDQIDFLPVVELFKSLLPGTGSAVFELIRGLYDDQNKQQALPRPLFYRGIPTYPSVAAFRLFSNFFTPEAPSGGDPVTVFMDPARSHQVKWLPAQYLPVRYFDETAHACLTVRDRELQKITLFDDPSGLPYVSFKSQRTIPYDRGILIQNGHLLVKDREQSKEVKANPEITLMETSSSGVPVSPVDWRSVFVQGIPVIKPAEAFGAVLLYPEDDEPVGELASQPFVADYLQDLAEQDREIGAMLSRAEHILIENGDAVIATCVAFDRPRTYTVLVHHPAFAQKQAQQLWTVSAELKRWDWLKQIRFLSHEGKEQELTPQQYDLIYTWVPFAKYDDLGGLTQHIEHLHRHLRSGGHAFLVGPTWLSKHLSQKGFLLHWEERVDQFPTFRMHRSILSKARLKGGLTLFLLTIK
jgi:hypothetical protein